MANEGDDGRQPLQRGALPIPDQEYPGVVTYDATWIQIDLGDDSHDHLIPPETHFQVAMTRQ